MSKKRNRQHAEPPSFESSLTRAVDRLMTRNPVNFSHGELRLAIGQEIWLDQTVPLAIDIIRGHPLTEGDNYPGDLLHAVLRVDSAWWQNHPRHFGAMKDIVAGIARTWTEDDWAAAGDWLEPAIAAWRD